MLRTSIAFVYVSFITLVMLWIPALSHYRARNAGVLMIIAWTSLGNITQAAAALSLLDASEAINPGWCDFGKF